MPKADTIPASGHGEAFVHHDGPLPLRDGIILLVCLVLAMLTLAIDLAIPLGVAVGVLHVIPTLVSLSSERRSITLGVAVVGTLLTIVDYVASPIAGVAPWVVIANRFLSILAIWVTTVLCLWQKERSRQAERLRTKNEFLLRFCIPAFQGQLVDPIS